MEPRSRRVAVTGLGVVAPCGIGVDAYWEGLLGPGVTDGRSTEIESWDPSPWYSSPKEARRADRVEQFAIAGDGGLRWRRDGGVDPGGSAALCHRRWWAATRGAGRSARAEASGGSASSSDDDANAAGRPSRSWGLQGPTRRHHAARPALTHRPRRSLISPRRCAPFDRGSERGNADVAAGFGNMTALTTSASAVRSTSIAWLVMGWYPPCSSWRIGSTPERGATSREAWAASNADPTTSRRRRRGAPARSSAAPALEECRSGSRDIPRSTPGTSRRLTTRPKPRPAGGGRDSVPRDVD